VDLTRSNPSSPGFRTAAHRRCVWPTTIARSRFKQRDFPTWANEPQGHTRGVMSESRREAWPAKPPQTALLRGPVSLLFLRVIVREEEQRQRSGAERVDQRGEQDYERYSPLCDTRQMGKQIPKGEQGCESRSNQREQRCVL